MMSNMMPGAMMSGFMLFWIVIGILLCLILVTAIIWFFAHWFNECGVHRMDYAPQPKDPSSIYEQGYQPPQQALETYQEGGQHYTYPQPQDEQPQAQYMQGMPLQH